MNSIFRSTMVIVCLSFCMTSQAAFCELGNHYWTSFVTAGATIPALQSEVASATAARDAAASDYSQSVADVIIEMASHGCSDPALCSTLWLLQMELSFAQNIYNATQATLTQVEGDLAAANTAYNYYVGAWLNHQKYCTRGCQK
jgi:hypothetical protein